MHAEINVSGAYIHMITHLQQVCCEFSCDGCSVTVTEEIRLTALSVAIRLFTHKLLDVEHVLSCGSLSVNLFTLETWQCCHRIPARREVETAATARTHAQCERRSSEQKVASVSGFIWKQVTA